MTRCFRLLLSLAASCACVGLAAQVPVQYPPPIIVPGVVKLGPHSYVIPDHDVTLVPNVGIVVGSSATLVIDTGLGLRNARTVLAEVAKVSRNKKLYLTVTHSHAEHVAGLGAFPAGTTFITSAAVKEELEQSGTRGFAGLVKLSPVFGEFVAGATLRPPDVVFEHDYLLDLGGVRVQLLMLGATHTPGDTLAFVEDDRVLYAGDVVVSRRFPSFGAQSRRQPWLDVLDQVAALKPRVIVSSHGENGTLASVDAQRRVLNEIGDRVAALEREGKSLEETTAVVVSEFRARYPDWRATIPNEIGPIVRGLFAE